MKKCIILFMVLIFTLVLAIVTDNDKSTIRENRLATNEVDMHTDVAAHKPLLSSKLLQEGE